MGWQVYFRGSAEKQLKELREIEQKKAKALVKAIETIGPVQGDWPNYSKLTRHEHHCHLSYRYVMVWKVIDEIARVIEVTYVGSREKAPY